MKKFSRDLRKHAIKIIEFEKKEIIPLTVEGNKPYCKQKACCICKKSI